MVASLATVTEPGSKADGAERRTAIELLVVVGNKLATYPLPATGSVVIGRAAECDVRVDDASVSRRHAILYVNPPESLPGGPRSRPGDPDLRIEDLGSANGLRLRAPASDDPRTAELREIKARPGEAIPLRVGDTVGLGVAVLVVRRADIEARRDDKAQSGGFVVRDPAMKKLHELAERVAQGQISVLLLGETGAGKEVLAESIHLASPRRNKPFLRLNCAALSESLLESELFGHEKGAFTGAVNAKAGLLESADGGTVFLDEIGELTPAIQVKLLRVLEDRKVTRVGGLAPRPVDVRFVAATNRDLEAEVRKGTFRQDLFFRLGGITLTIPPLRERRAEIEPLARFFAGRAAAQLGRTAPPLSRAALDALEKHPWPGNVRELRNVMERAVVLADTEDIAPDHLMLVSPRPADAPALSGPTLISPPAAPATAKPESAAPAPAGGGAGLKAELDALERQRILDALATFAGNQTQAAAALGMSRRTFIARLDEYGIPRPRKK
jgi:DNA-binding NtrC family response regulator